MKTNDIINEGPVWDAIKSVGQNIKAGPRAAISGVKRAYQQGQVTAQNKQNQAELNTQAKNMMPYWLKHAQALQASGDANMRDLGVYQEEMQNWMSTSGFPGNKDFSKLGNLNSTEPIDVQNYLAKAVALNAAGRLPSKTPPQDQQSQNQQTQGQQAPAAPVAPAQPQPTAAPKFTSPQQVVDSMVKTLPPDWLPTITAELLKRQKVGATPK